jgi:hypothetical protein
VPETVDVIWGIVMLVDAGELVLTSLYRQSYWYGCGGYYNHSGYFSFVWVAAAVGCIVVWVVGAVHAANNSMIMPNGKIFFRGLNL